VLLIVFQILCFLCAIADMAGIKVQANTYHISGIVLYHLVLYVGLCCFVTGTAGNISLFIKRLADKNLSSYTSPAVYAGYLFNTLLCGTGLYVWYFADPSYSMYRDFWKSMITFNPVQIDPATTIFVILAAFHLIHLPFTRAFHYISRILAFFLIRWDDAPNIRGGNLEKKILKLFDQKITWSAPHIQPGKTWKEVTR